MLSAKWWSFCLDLNVLTHWGRVTHICVSKLAIIGSDNGLSPDRRQAIIWTNDGIVLIGTLGTNFSEILIENRIFSFKKMGLKVSSAKWHPFCLGLNVLMSAIVPQLLSGRVSEWVIKFNSLSGDIGQWGPYSPYKPCNHIHWNHYLPSHRHKTITMKTYPIQPPIIFTAEFCDT